MRVLLLIASSELGGAERVLVTLLRGLRRSEVEAWVAAPPHGPMFSEFAGAAAGIRAHDLRGIFDLRSTAALAVWIRRQRFDVVHTHLWTADVIGGVASALAGVSLRIATVHTEYFRAVDLSGARAWRKSFLSRVYRAAYRPFHRVIAVSRSVAVDLAERTGCRVAPERIDVIRNGIDPEDVLGPPSGLDRSEWRLPAEGPLVVTVANFVPMKGYPELLRAIPLVLARFPTCTFALLGGGPELPAVRRAAELMGAGERVRFLGARPDAIALMKLADVVVLPSITAEGIPITCLEALALARPLVATRVGGVPEIGFSHPAGRLVPPRDPMALAQGIIGALCDPRAAVSSTVEGPRLVAERFSAERMLREYLALYRAGPGVRSLPCPEARGTGRT